MCAMPDHETFEIKFKMMRRNRTTVWICDAYGNEMAQVAEIDHGGGTEPTYVQPGDEIRVRLNGSWRDQVSIKALTLTAANAIQKDLGLSDVCIVCGHTAAAHHTDGCGAPSSTDPRARCSCLKFNEQQDKEYFDLCGGCRHARSAHYKDGCNAPATYAPSNRCSCLVFGETRP